MNRHQQLHARQDGLARILDEIFPRQRGGSDDDDETSTTKKGNYRLQSTLPQSLLIAVQAR